MGWARDFAASIQRDADLSERVTIRAGGRARWLVEPRTAEETGALLDRLSGEGCRWRVLGGGSNVLPPDGVLDDVVIHPARMDWFDVDGDQVSVGAGLATPKLVARCSEAGLAGVHVLAGVPGQVGGAVAMNAGTRHGEMCESVQGVHVVLADGRLVTLTRGDLRFGYRSAQVPPGAVICGVTLGLQPVEDRRELRRTVGRYIKEKNAVQPTRSWNFGCMFKNPEGQKAGVLLDRAGLKGLQRGGARISPLHANFVENVEEARSEDVLWLLQQSEVRVLEHAGVRLEREVRTW